MKLSHLDHFVLTVHDINATIAFYVQVFGMEVVTFGEGRKTLTFGAQKINLHQQGQEFEPKAQHPTPGSADLCFIAATPIAEVMAQLQAQGITIEVGPVERTGAQGAILSVYVRDPDSNLIEIANYR
jgi:catechol 2,3-dioxygenase-like lactoylglutathione lyase family enzyme